MVIDYRTKTLRDYRTKDYMGLFDFLDKLDREIDRLGEYVTRYEQEVKKYARMRRLLQMLEEEERRDRERRRRRT